MTITPEIVIESPATRPMPAAEATMLIVTEDTREKYVNRRDKHDVHARETVAVPAVDRGGRRHFSFAPSTVSFDTWRDKTNVGGAVYKYFVFALTDPATSKVLHFQTNHPQLSRTAAGNESKQKEVLQLAKGKEFPREFK